MKRIITLTIAFLTLVSICFSQNAIFLHHSTGGGVYYNGNVEGCILNYNIEHSTNFSITERSYPDSPYPWENYPYDFWNLWVNGSCSESQPGIECLNLLTQNYKLIIFKHCFPGAAIREDTGSPDIASDRKSLENYKLQYRALRSVMDSYPDNMFMVWTLAPLHRNATSVEEAARAREFVNWVKNTWLNEDGNSHPNISVFDFYNIVAESNPTPVNGRVNCLKYDYEGDHNGDDSHPNYEANQVTGPIFANAIANCLENVPEIKVGDIGITSESGSFSINVIWGALQLHTNILPVNADNKSITWSIINGEELAWLSPDGLLHANRNGIVRVQVSANDGSGVSSYVDITITNQPVSVYHMEIRSAENTNEIKTDNGTLHLIAHAMPEDIDYTNVTWSIYSGSEIITVSETGVVTALTNGYATVVANSNDSPGVTAFYDVFVSNQVNPIESLSIETEGGADKIDVPGGVLQLRANIVPANRTSSITWSIIRGEELAWITPDGMLLPIHNGVVRVQVSANDGTGVSAFIDITISNQPVTVYYMEIRSVENSNEIITDNGTLHLITHAMPEDIDYTNVTWSIFSGSEIITVSETGVVTALTNGYATVVANSKDSPGITAFYDILVSNQVNPIESLSIETEGGADKIDVQWGMLQLRANVVPANTTSPITWSIIEGEELAWITPDGMLQANRNGLVRVQVSANDGSGVSAFIDITISNQPVTVYHMEIRSAENTNEIKTDIGTLHLIAHAMPEDIDYTNVTWSIFSGSEVVTVSETGVVTALTNGYATVVANSKDSPGITAFYDILVSNQVNPIESLSIETEGGADKIDVPGGMLQLRANVVPINTTSSLEWSIISGEELAWLSPDGLLFAIQNGIVRVQVSANDGSGVSAYVDITISNQTSSFDELSASDIELNFNENEGSYSIRIKKDINQVKLRMYDISGKLVWMADRYSADCFIPHQKPGVYILKIEHNKLQMTRKVVY